MAVDQVGFGNIGERGFERECVFLKPVEKSSSTEDASVGEL